MYHATTPTPITLTNHPEHLDGLVLCFLSDLNNTQVLNEQLSGLATTAVDVLLLSGPEAAPKGGLGGSIRRLEGVLESISPRYGCFGVFTHAVNDLWRDAAKSLEINWLENETQAISGLPMNITGVSARPNDYDSGDLLHARLTGERSAQRSAMDILLLPNSGWFDYARFSRFDFIFSSEMHQPVRCRNRSSNDVPNWVAPAGPALMPAYALQVEKSKAKSNPSES